MFEGLVNFVPEVIAVERDMDSRQQRIARAEVRQTRFQAQQIIAYAGKEERIALQVNGLALVSSRDPHVTDQYVRQTPKRLLSHTGPIQ